MEQFRYSLRVNLTIEKEVNRGGLAAPDGSATDEFNPPSWRRENNEHLTVSEDLNLGSMDFLGLMHVLSEMHNAVSETALKGRK